MEERQPWLTYVVILALYVLLGLLSLIVIPFVVGIFRQQTHRCQKCLNHFKTNDSLFESMNDTILEFSIYNFGVIVRRKTLVKSLAFVLASTCLYFLIGW